MQKCMNHGHICVQELGHALRSLISQFDLHRAILGAFQCMSKCMGDPDMDRRALTKKTTGLVLLELSIVPLLAICASIAGELPCSASPVTLAAAGPAPSGM